MKQPKNIFIMMLSGAYNLGDELILRAEIDLFQKKYPNAQFHIATYDENSFLWEKKNIHFLSFFPNNFKKHIFHNFFFLLKNIFITWKSDIIVIGGGGIFFDNEPGISFWKNLLEWKIRLFFARLFRKKVIFLGISLEVKNPENQKKLAKIFRKTDVILPRDERSSHILASYELYPETVWDSVFLQSAKNQHKTPPKKWRIGIALRPWFLTKSDVEVVSKLCRTLSNNNVEVIFLSHSFSSSEWHNDEIFARKNFVDNCRITMSMNETLEAYKNIDIIISMRLHSMILAAQYGIPTILIPYWPKTISIGKQLDIYNDAIFPEQFNETVFLEKIHYLQNNYEKKQGELSAKYKEIHEKFLQKLEKTDILDI